MKAKLRHVAMLLVFAACGPKTPVDTQVFLDSTPTRDALAIDPSADNPVALTPANDGIARDNSSGIADQLSNDLIGELNDRIRDLVASVEDLVATPPSKAEALVHEWRKQNAGLAYRFTMSRGGPARFGWLLEAKKIGEPDSAFARILAGGIRRNAAAHRGTGLLLLDFDAYAAVAAGTATTVLSRGKFGAAFTHAPNATLLEYGVSAYTGSNGDEPAHAAFFRALHINKTAAHPLLGFFRVGGRRALPLFGSGEETVVARVRRLQGLGGWARATVFGGNVSGGEAYLVRECWGAQAAVAYRRVWRCDLVLGRTSNCTQVVNAQLPPLGGVLPLDGASAPPDGVLEKATLRTVCANVLGDFYAGLAAADVDPPADEGNTSEDESQSGLAGGEIPALPDSLSGADSASGAPPAAD